jgi:hypothetical protein
MNIRFARFTPWLALAVLSLAACSNDAASTALTTPSGSHAPVAVSAGAELTRDTSQLPVMVVHKTPWCGCCGAWVEHMQHAGFEVEVHDMDDLGPIKERLGVPYAKGSCHTTEIGGYLMEGHVPAEDIKRLLQERPDAVGLVLPGMPMGSPGMGAPNDQRKSFTVEIVRRDGTTEPFSSH